MRLYKFLRTGLKSEYGDCQWTIGEWKKEENIAICSSGFHASEKVFDAFSYVRGELLARVEVRGDCIKQSDKQVWSEMRIVKAYRWKKEDSVALAIFAAEQVISVYEKKYPNDERPRKSIEAAKAYLENPSARAAARATRAALAARAAARAAYAAYAARSAADAAYAAADAAIAADAINIKIEKWMRKRIKTLEEVN